MGGKGLDFKHKEVINITDGKRLGFVQDVTANLETGVLKVVYTAITPRISSVYSISITPMILTAFPPTSSRILIKTHQATSLSEPETE